MPAATASALILFSHGSLLCGAGETLRRHARRIREEEGERYLAVEVGYLNYTEPAFEVAVERCQNAGARRIVVAPYFLVAGKFVRVDLPARIEEARRRYPELEFVLADAVLDEPGMADAIVELAATARPPSRWRDDLNSAPLFCQGRPDCPLYETPACPKGPRAAPGAAPRPDAQAGCVAAADSSAAERPSGGARSALLVMVHGSPRPESNDDVYRILDSIRGRGGYDLVQPAFMECNEPAIPEAIDLCVAEGAERVVAVPYFLHTGNHVADDLPGLLEEACRRHPGVEFLMASYVGTSSRVTAVLEKRAHEALARLPV